MMEFLRFTFSTGWHFAGVAFLLITVLDYGVNGLVQIVRALRPAKAAVPPPSIVVSAPGETR